MSVATLTRSMASYTGKLPTYVKFPAFSIANTWRGASEIIRKYNFNLENKNSITQLFSSPPTGANFCPCISWKPTSTTIVRYKLWEDVGEILWVPLYTGQTIGADFAIEIWNTPDATITLPAAQILYLSKLVIPDSYCDDDAVQVGLDYRTCTDLIFDLEDYIPADGDYYLVISDCGVTELIKNQIFSDGWLLKADDDTWHTLSAIIDPIDSSVHFTTTPAATPDPLPTPYAPLIDRYSGLGFQISLLHVEGSYHLTAAGLASVDSYGRILLLADDDQYYAMRLTVEDWNTFPYVFPESEKTTGTFRLTIAQTPTPYV